MIAVLVTAVVWLAICIPGAIVIGKGLTMCARRDRERRGLS